MYNYTLTAKDTKQRSLRGSVGACRVEVYSLGALYSLGSRVWGSRVSGHPFWVWLCTHFGGLHAGGLHSGGLESRATDFGSGSAHTLGVYILGVYTLGV